jgi:hypothetical protein
MSQARQPPDDTLVPHLHTPAVTELKTKPDSSTASPAETHRRRHRPGMGRTRFRAPSRRRAAGPGHRRARGSAPPPAGIAQACLLAVASCPGVSRVLLSASTPAHWDTARTALNEPPLPAETLRKALDVLAPHHPD